jgi:hypothetical protein
MPTIIDSLVVELGLDPKKFAAGQKAAQSRIDKFDAAVKKLGIDETKLDATQKKHLKSLRDIATQSQRTGKELKSAGGAVEDFWATAKSGAMAFGAALGATALGDMARQAITANASVLRLSATLGMQAGEVDAWKKAIREATGSSGDGAFGTLQSISDTLSGARFGKGFGDIPRIAALLSRASGTPLPFVKANGQPMDPEELLLSWADPIKKMGLQAAHGLGTGLDDDTLQFLSKGRSADEAALADARKNTLTPKGFSDAERAAKELNVLSDSVSHLADTLTLMGAPRAIRDITQFNATLGLITGKISPGEYLKQYQAAQDEYAGDPGGIKRKTDEAMGAFTRPPMFDPGNPNFRYGAPDATGGYVRWTDDERRTRLAQLISAGMTPKKAAEKVAFEEGMGMPAAHYIAKGLGLGGTAPGGLLAAVEKVESGGNPNAVSAKGAEGLMQIMPDTWKDLAAADPTLGNDPTNPAANRRAGAEYLSNLFAKYHDWAKALAAYNWGQAALDNDIAGHGDAWRQFLPQETAAYLTNVTAANGGSLPSNDTTINTGPITIHAPGGHPDTIAKGLNKSLVAQAQSGPS